MVGCGLIWGACALAAVVVLKHRCGWRRRMMYGGYGAYGGGCGAGWREPWEGGGWREPWEGGGPHHGRRGFGGFGLRAILRGLFERLGTTPGQEKAVVAALEELREALHHAKDELRASRKDFADAFRRGPIDEAAMADIFVRHDTVISETRRKAVEAVGKASEALDERQRAEVADLIERGFGSSWRGRGPSGYRG